jgi:hypothetical protein
MGAGVCEWTASESVKGTSPAVRWWRAGAWTRAWAWGPRGQGAPATRSTARRASPRPRTAASTAARVPGVSPLGAGTERPATQRDREASRSSRAGVALHTVGGEGRPERARAAVAQARPQVVGSRAVWEDGVGGAARSPAGRVDGSRGRAFPASGAGRIAAWKAVMGA